MGDHPKTGLARYGLVERAMKVASEADFPYATEDFFKGADKLGIKYDEQDVRLLKVFSIPDKMAKMKVKDEWDKMDARAKKLPPRFFEDYFDALLNVANEEIPGKD